jgi:hypothetical protein
VAFRVAEGLLEAPELQRVTAWGKRAGISVDVASDSAPVPAGWESVFVSTVPAPETVRRQLARFPVRIEEKGFVFDGRTYRGPEDAIALADPGHPGEAVVVGNGARAVLRLAARRVFWHESGAPDYEVVAGDLTKTGRFGAGSRPLAVDRATDHDEIASQEEFLRSQETFERGGVRWRLRETERAAIVRWEPALRKFLAGRKAGPISIRLYPDAATKARVNGSSRPADLSRERDDVVVDLDVSAPADPDCVTPVLASAAFAAEDRRLLARPMVLAALGARACGRWWGRDVAGFAAFARAAHVAPAVEQVIRSDEEISPILAVGAAASWLEAGERTEGEAAMHREVAGTDAECARALARWASLAEKEGAMAPRRRALPADFLRGISYAMTNSVGGSYASPRSKETLARVSKLSVNSVSVMPFAFSRDPKRPEISFVHRSPQGETDEGTVRAVADARALGMTAMIKPQVWLPGAFVGEVAMGSEEDWRRWFDAYRRFVVHHALVAEASGAALFCVGTELVGSESHRKEWMETIAAVRLATGAPLTYASNWAAGAPRVPFWGALDAIGVDFYDPLSSNVNASEAELEAGARRAAAPLSELARKTGKPVLLAEAGYPPVRGAWIEPHDENTGRPLAPGDAARAIAAVFRALDRETWWKGVYWWKAFSDGRNARADERGYNVLGSPAEKVIAEGFARLAAERRASK